MALLVCNPVFFPGLETFDHLKLTYDRVWGGGGGAELQKLKCRTGGNVEASI